MKKYPDRKRRDNAGFTLIELMIAGTVLTLLVGAVVMISQATERAYHLGAVKASLEQQTAATIAKVMVELGIASSESLAPPLLPGTEAVAVQYVQATGMVAGDVEWTPVRRLAFEYETGEVDDGIDNNGNGLIDEGAVVLTEDLGGAGERRRVLTHWVRELAEGEEANGVDDNGNGLVDEPGFSLRRLGETLTVRLTLEKRSPDGMPLVRTARTSTRLRN